MKYDFKNIFIYLLGVISLHFYLNYPLNQIWPFSIKLLSLLHYHGYYDSTLSNDYGMYLAYHL